MNFQKEYPFFYYVYNDDTVCIFQDTGMYYRSIIEGKAPSKPLSYEDLVQEIKDNNYVFGYTYPHQPNFIQELYKDLNMHIKKTDEGYSILVHEYDELFEIPYELNDEEDTELADVENWFERHCNNSLLRFVRNIMDEELPYFYEKFPEYCHDNFNVMGIDLILPETISYENKCFVHRQQTTIDFVDIDVEREFYLSREFVPVLFTLIFIYKNTLLRVIEFRYNDGEWNLIRDEDKI